IPLGIYLDYLDANSCSIEGLFELILVSALLIHQSFFVTTSIFRKQKRYIVKFQNASFHVKYKINYLKQIYGYQLKISVLLENRKEPNNHDFSKYTLNLF